MKKYAVTININLELDADADLADALRQLMYTPSIAGGTCKLHGINVHKQESSQLSGLPLAGASGP